MPQKIFISYVDADKRYLNKIKRWGKRKKCGDIEIIFSTRDDKGMKTKRGRIIRPKLERKIKEADLIIVLVGNANDSHPWVRYEKFADEHKLVRYFMRIPYTEHPLPDALKGLTQIAYNPNAIEKLFRSETTVAIQVQAQSPTHTSDIAAKDSDDDGEGKDNKDKTPVKTTEADTTTEKIDPTADEESAVDNKSPETEKGETPNDETVA